MAAPGGDSSSEEEEEERCDLFRCFCKWRKRCSPRIPRVYPGRDYVCISSDAAAGDGTPKWSVLIGCTSAGEPFHNLRTHRFRVADSGRVMGCSDGLLERFRGVSPDDDEHTVFSSATAAMAPVGRNICIICAHYPSFHNNDHHHQEADLLLPKAFLMDSVDKSLTQLPSLPYPDHGSYASYHSVSAHGELWMPAITMETGPFGIKTRLAIYQLDRTTTNNYSWAMIRDIDFPYRRPSVSSGPPLHGYAVIMDRYILLSFVDRSFFCFDCATNTLSRVTKLDDETNVYVPIRGRAVHVHSSSDNGIYFLEGATLFRYSYSPEAEAGKPLKPPQMVVTICPYRKEGYGFVVHLRDNMLCTVWINMSKDCKCATRHVLITTLLVGCRLGKDGFEPKDVEVLHSTCRRIGMLRSMPPETSSYDRFCFLQEFLDDSLDIDHSAFSTTRGLQVDKVQQKMLPCCRSPYNSIFSYQLHFTIVHRNFLIGTSRAITLEDCKVMTKPNLYIVCQVGQCSLLYKISNSRGKLAAACHEKVLQPQFSVQTVRPRDDARMIDDPYSWHFVHQGSKIYGIPSSPLQSHYEFDLNTNLHNLLECKRPNACFSMVSRAGQHIVALGATLQDVYILDQYTRDWVPCQTSSRSLDLAREVKIAGFVDLIDDALVVSDYDSPDCFLLDLKKREWFPVNHLDIYDYVTGTPLNGRCRYAKGFIYMCTQTGIFAFELVKESDLSYRLDTPTLLQFQWERFSDSRLMSLDLIYEDIDASGAMVFCVVEGHTRLAHLYRSVSSDHELTITTVQVNLKGSERGVRIPVGIKHVDIAISSIKQEGWILTNYAFAV
uniref:Uncharacterized protein n=1 Tax=Leersia perrieri TaxID=77586 RepID=A0A0D9XZR0_9ORYZ